MISKGSRVFLLIWVVLVGVLLSGLSPSSSYAYDLKQGINLHMKPSTWCQACAQSDYGYSAWIDKPYGLFHGSMRGGACGQFSATSLLIRAGVKPLGYTVVNYIKDTQKLQQANKASMTSRDWVFFETTSPRNFAQAVRNMSKNELEFDDAGGTSRRGRYSVADVKKWYDQGYFIILLTTGHWIAVDSVSADGVIHTIDSGAPVTTYSPQAYAKWRSEGYSHIERIIKFKRTDGKRPQDLPTIDKIVSQPIKGDAPKLSEGTITEQDLIGMPPRTEGYETQLSSEDFQAFQNTVQDVERATRTALSEVEADNVDQLNTVKKLEAYNDADTVFRIAVAVIGILLILYAVLLFLAFMLDYTQSFVDFSTLLSLGYLRTVRGDTEVAPPRGVWATPRNVLLTALVLTFLGGISVNGVLIAWVSTLIEGVYHAIGE